MKPETSSEKSSGEVYIVNDGNASTIDVVETKKSSRLTKKHLLIAVASLIAVGFVVTCVLVAIRIYGDTEKEILLMSFSKDNTNINVSVDHNVVLHHAVNEGSEAWVVCDFDKDIMTIKMRSESGVICYASPLNTSMMIDPKTLLSLPPMNHSLPAEQLYLSVLSGPIDDITFMTTRARNLCQNLQTYWVVPSYRKESSDDDRVKRRIDGSITITIGCVTITIKW